MPIIMLIQWQLPTPRRSWWMLCFDFDGSNYFRLSWRSSGYNCCCTPVSCPCTSGSICVNSVVNLVWSNGDETASVFQDGVTSSTSNTRTWTVVVICSSREVLNCHGRDEKWLMLWWCWSSGGRRVDSSLALRRKLLQFGRRCGKIVELAAD